MWEQWFCNHCTLGVLPGVVEVPWEMFYPIMLGSRVVWIPKVISGLPRLPWSKKRVHLKELFFFQMMAILSAMMGNVKTVPVQFNENAAWSPHLSLSKKSRAVINEFFIWRGCQEYTCIDTCTTFALVNGNYLTPVQVNTTSCKDGLLEPSCRQE